MLVVLQEDFLLGEVVLQDGLDARGLENELALGVFALLHFSEDFK